MAHLLWLLNVHDEETKKKNKANNARAVVQRQKFTSHITVRDPAQQ